MGLNIHIDSQPSRWYLASKCELHESRSQWFTSILALQILFPDSPSVWTILGKPWNAQISNIRSHNHVSSPVQNINWALYAALGTAVVADLWIALLLCYFLARSKTGWKAYALYAPLSICTMTQHSVYQQDRHDRQSPDGLHSQHGSSNKSCCNWLLRYGMAVSIILCWTQSLWTIFEVCGAAQVLRLHCLLFQLF